MQTNIEAYENQGVGDTTVVVGTVFITFVVSSAC